MSTGSVVRRAFLPDAHHRLTLGVFLSAVAFFLLQGRIDPASQVIAVWDVFVAVDLALAWRVIILADPSRLRETAKLQDSSRTAIFAVVLLAACAAFISVAFMLGPSRSTASAGLGLHLALSLIAVVGAWMVVHTLFALRYAHLFYGLSKSADRDEPASGLRFPGTLKPDYLDFAYFSFVIGMTSQVSDVQILSRRLRRLAMVHGTLSFFFNVVILGMTISIMSGLLQ
jgi:uncharacterized membrane protein